MNRLSGRRRFGNTAMIRDVLAVQKIHHYRGHTIRVQKTSLVYKMQYGLVIDGVKQDQLEGLYGTFSLHGVVEDDDRSTPVEVIVKQGFFTGAYFCRIDGKTARMKSYRIEGI